MKIIDHLKTQWKKEKSWFWGIVNIAFMITIIILWILAIKMLS